MAGVLGSAELYEHVGGRPPTEEELAERYARQVVGSSPDGSQQWWNWVVLDPAGTLVGYVQASRAVGAPTAEVAWVVGVPWQGRGHASRAARLMLDALRRQGVREVVADIHPANAASAAVARHLGMVATDEVVDGETRWRGRTASSR